MGDGTGMWAASLASPAYRHAGPVRAGIAHLAKLWAPDDGPTCDGHVRSAGLKAGDAPSATASFLLCAAGGAVTARLASAEGP